MAVSAERTRFVAYVYPGWHPDPFRPGIREWDLVERFHPYFEGHGRPPRPIDGPYDDSKLETAVRQVSLASDHGIDAFTYFTYYEPSGLVMDAPMAAARQAAEERGDFGIGSTWCIRLPHRTFPVRRDEAHDPLPSDSAPHPGIDGPGALDDLPIELTSIRDLQELLGAEAADELRLASARPPSLAPDTWRRSGPDDASLAPGPA